MLSRCAEIVRRHDPDRFLTVLFAPPARREALFTLYAFNHELARAREVASEPTLALIRLQWWREVVLGQRRRHEVAAPLGEAIRSGLLAEEDLLALVAAREIEAEPGIATLADWRSYLLGGAGGLAVAAARLLGATAPETVRTPGAAYGAVGMLRNLPILARQGRCLLPVDLLRAHRLTIEEAMAQPHGAPLAPVRAALADVARDWLGEAHAARLPRAAIAAILPAVLARRDLHHMEPVPRGIGARIAVTLAAWRGRL